METGLILTLIRSIRQNSGIKSQNALLIIWLSKVCV
jgi:hypothetical protein